jgi:protein involved in polysaccharide export with SLBB domain
MRLATRPTCCAGALVVLSGLAGLPAFAREPAPATPAAVRVVSEPEPAAPLRNRVEPDTYRVGPGDELMLRGTGTSEPVWLRVGPAGELALPREGPIPAAGLTLKELEAHIRERLGPRATPDLGVTLHRPRRFRIMVVGEVKDPGAVTLQAPARASEAVAAAGGVTAIAARRGIRVIRGPDTLLADLVRVERTGETRDDPLVFESDVIHVPALGPFIEMVGAAPRPGRLAFVPGDRLSDLVALSGGVLPQAALRHAELTRMDEQGLPRRHTVGLEAALRTPGGPDDLPLAEGDRLYIPAQSHWRQGPRVEVVGEVTRPGPYPIAEGEDRVLSVLERAGGLTELAEPHAVRIERWIGATAGDSLLLTLARGHDAGLTAADRELARLKARERQALSVDVSALNGQGSESGNALLLDGDRVVVPRHRPMVSIQGEVRSPGYVRWRPAATLWDYVADAGGLTRRAHRKHVRVTVATTGQQVDPSEVPEIRAGDTIWVPARRERSAWEITRDLLAATAQASTFFLVIREATR